MIAVRSSDHYQSIGMACALKVLPHLHPDSLVFIHDFYSRLEHYKGVLEYYVEVARVLAYRNGDPTQGPIDEPQGLIVLRRNASANFPVSEEEIHVKYAAVDWRYPFADPLVSPLAYFKYYTGFLRDLGMWSRPRNVDMLVRLVRLDILRMVVLYGVLLLVGRYWKGGVWAGPATERAKRGGERPSKAGSVPGGTRRGERRGGIGRSQSAARAIDMESGRAKGKSEPRFVETEAMKAANARRKARQGGGEMGKGS